MTDFKHRRDLRDYARLLCANIVGPSHLNVLAPFPNKTLAKLQVIFNCSMI